MIWQSGFASFVRLVVPSLRFGHGFSLSGLLQPVSSGFLPDDEIRLCHWDFVFRSEFNHGHRHDVFAAETAQSIAAKAVLQFAVKNSMDGSKRDGLPDAVAKKQTARRLSGKTLCGDFT